ITHYERAIAIQPGDAGAHLSCGNALVEAGRMDEALDHYRSALKLQPGFTQAHNNLAFVLLRTGQPHEAIAHFQTALRLEPENVRTLSNLAWLLATCPDASVRDGAKAIELAQRANELSDRRDPVVLRALA